ncbi:MAG: TonB-dependent receptor [Alphaproteobacteria bacterium]|nr:MAG: TonB-dependent receptor [Alphaproteobacteria bacterium]
MTFAGTAIGTSMLLSASILAAEAVDEDFVFEEILVTATKRAMTIQDVPFSLNALTQKDIQRTGATSLEDVARNVAGLMIQNLGPGQSQVAIRGVSAGQIVRDQPGVKEQVGVYLDESVISLSLFTPDLDLYDLNRVEVLRGPQGTLFGSGSVGGTIRYITNQPDLEGFSGTAEADINVIDGGGTGGYVKGMVNFPIAEDKAAIRVVGYHTEYGGFIDALREGGSIDENVNSGSRSGGRITLMFQPTEMIKITPRVIYQEIKTDGNNRQEVFNLYANPFTTTRPAVTFEERQQFLLLREGFEDQTLIADAVIEVSFDGFDVTSVTSYTDRDILVSRDASALTGSVSIDFSFPEAGVLLPSNLLDSTKVGSFTQEFRLSSNSDGRLQWLVGGFYSTTDRDYKQDLPTPGYDAFLEPLIPDITKLPPDEAPSLEDLRGGIAPLDSPFFSLLSYTLEQVAIFAEATYDITDEFHFTAGGRYYDYNEERSVSQVGIFGAGIVGQIDETSSSGFTPRFLASYEVSDAITLNAQVSKGFRLGGVNDPLNAALCEDEDLAIFGGFQSYDDETLWNYEAGVKINTGNMTLNAAAFYTKMSNLQVTLDAGSCSSRISFNVESAHSQGIEVEFKAHPMEGLNITIASSLIESEFDSTVLDKDGAVLGGVREGNRLPSTPKFNIAVTASYDFPLEMISDEAEGYVSATFQHRSSVFTQPSDQEPGAGTFASTLAFGGASGLDETVLDLELDAYQSLNISAGVILETWEVVAYVKNVTDENANLSFDRERGGRARLGFRTNQPRTFGLTVRAFF